MKIRSQKREGNKVFIEAEEDYSAFEKAAEKALIEAGKEVKVPGFRAGKAPRDMVERAVNREAVDYHAAQGLIADLYPQIIAETDLQPVDYPDVEVVQQEKGKPFAFKLSVDVYPEVKLGRYKGLKAEKKSAAVTEEEVLKILGNLQQRMAATDAEGKKEVFPLDDEFAKKVSRHGTLAELKAEVLESLQKEKAAEAEADLKNKLVAAAAAEALMEIPPAMLEREIDIMLDELKTSLAQSGLTLEDYLKGTRKEEKALREEMRKSAEIRVRGKVVLKAVAQAEKLKISPEEMQAEFKALAESSGQNLSAFEKNLGDGGKGFIEDYLVRRKALEFITEKASVKEEVKK
jgi:FKBP-type peptidyl-prolyl cis-trans isomerase (trigger factor)